MDDHNGGDARIAGLCVFSLTSFGLGLAVGRTCPVKTSPTIAGVIAVANAVIPAQWRCHKINMRGEKMELKIVKVEWKSGVGKKSGKPYTGLELTLQGAEKFTVPQMLFLNDTQCQLLGIEKPTAENK